MKHNQVKWIYVLLLVFICRLDLMGQSRQTVANSQQDTVLIKKLLDSAKAFRYKDTARHLAIVENAIQLANKVNDKRFLAMAYSEKAVHATDENAIKIYQVVLPLAKESKDTMLMATVNNYLGYRYNQIGQRMKGLDYFFETLKLLSKKPPTREYEIALSSIGNTYMNLGDRRGFEYQQQCFELVSKRVGSDSVKLSLQLINFAVANYAFGDTAKAIDLTERCLNVAKKNQPIKRHAIVALSNLIQFYSNWSDAGLASRRIDIDELWNKVKAYSDYTASFSKENNIDIKDQLPNIYFNLGRVLVRKKQYNEGLQYMLKAKGLSHHDNRPYYDEISTAYAGLKQFDSAYKYHKDYLAWKESAQDLELKKTAERKQVEFEFSKVKDSLQFVEQLTHEQLKQKEMVAQQQAQELKLQEALLALNTREKELANLGLEKANAEIIVNHNLVVEKQKQLVLAEKEKALQTSEATLKRTQLLAAKKELDAQKRLQLFYLVGSAVVLLFLFMLFRNYKNRQKAKAQIAAEKLKTQKAEAVRKMAEFEMHGLRAQLNPHFMFNSLNAIQAQILREDNENAGTYLNTFARMLRQLLENAEYSFVSLEKELEFLRLYLRMEQLRIKDLEFDMNIDPAIDPERTMIPNMILQPYLENAIWHGLSPKQGKKYVRIHILHLDEGISIRITDNGIGRKKAAELQSKYRKAHKSKGMELLRKRFELIQAEFGSEIKIEIEDLQDMSEDVGTSIQLVIPHTFSEPMRLVRETVLNN